MVRNSYGIVISEKNHRFSLRKIDKKDEQVLELGREFFFGALTSALSMIF